MTSETYQAGKDSLALGLGYSTQGLSARVMHPTQGTIALFDVPYASLKDVNDFGVTNGFLDTRMGTVVAPVLMFVSATDAILKQINDCPDFATSDIKVVTGNVQQHGTAALKEHFFDVLALLNPSTRLDEQLAKGFSSPFASIWMDSSTEEECELFAKAVGGNDKLAKLTGARATLRFSGPQWLRFALESPRAFDRTYHLTQLSGMLAAVWLGKEAPIDLGNGLGSNMIGLDGKWCPEILDLFDEHDRPVENKLPKISSSLSVIGKIAPYFVQTYGFSPKCRVLTFSGDNPDSALGVGLYSHSQKMRIWSGGTSITQFSILDPEVAEPADPAGYGAIFGAVTGGLLGINTHSNGTLVPEWAKNLHSLSWSQFGESLRRSKPGNDGKWGIFLRNKEITPVTKKPIVRYFGPSWNEDDQDALIRAVCESQGCALMAHSAWLGETTEFLATGGASVDPQYLQVLADVTNCSFIPADNEGDSDSTTLGSCLRGLHIITQQSFETLTALHCKRGKAITPQTEAGFYDRLHADYRAAVAEEVAA
jgi:xylulokinase